MGLTGLTRFRRPVGCGSPTRGSSSVGRASASQAEGRGFESRLPLRFRRFEFAFGDRARDAVASRRVRGAVAPSPTPPLRPRPRLRAPSRPSSAIHEPLRRAARAPRRRLGSTARSRRSEDCDGFSPGRPGDAAWGGWALPRASRPRATSRSRFAGRRRLRGRGAIAARSRRRARSSWRAPPRPPRPPRCPARSRGASRRRRWVGRGCGGSYHS